MEPTLFAAPGKEGRKPGNEIHLWKFPVLPVSPFFLNEEERNIAAGFHFEADRNRFMVGRLALRTLFSRYLGVDPRALVFTIDKFGKPVLKQPAAGIHFNISHSGEWVILGIAAVELGVDLEKIDRAFVYTDILQEYFSPEEQDFVEQFPDPSAAFCYIWTRKEALVKAWGHGLTENLRELTVLRNEVRVDQNKKWQLESFSLSALYPAAIAFPTPGTPVCFFDGSSLLV